MCLKTATMATLAEFNETREGYKVMRLVVDNPTQYKSAIFIGPAYGCLAWNDAKVTTETEVTTTRYYPTGWHICRTKEAALAWAKDSIGCSGQHGPTVWVMVPVTYRQTLCYGPDGRASMVDVAMKIKFGEDYSLFSYDDEGYITGIVENQPK